MRPSIGPMDVNELTNLECAACGEAVDVLAEAFEPVLPLLCGRCLVQLIEDAAEPQDLPAAA